MESISANRRVDTTVPTLLTEDEVPSSIGETFSLQISSQPRPPVAGGLDGSAPSLWKALRARRPVRVAPNWRSSCSSAEEAAELTTCVLLLGQDGMLMPAGASQDEGADRAGTRRRDETR